MKLHQRLRPGIAVALVGAAGVGGCLTASAQNINLRFGSLYARYSLGANAALRYTDNVDLEEDNPRSDLLLDFGPTISGDMGLGGGVGPELRLPGGEEFRLKINFGFNTQYSFRDGVTESYGAPISAQATVPIYIRYLGWTVTLSDDFDHTRRSLDTTFGFGQQNIPVYDNIARLSAYRSFGRTTLTLGVSRTDQWVTDREFEDQERATYGFFVNPSYALNENMSVFWSNSYNINELEGEDSRDSRSWSSSVGISGLITREISGMISLGYSHNTLEGGTTNGIPVAHETFSGLNNNVSLNYASPLRPYTTHSLGFFHTVDVPAGLSDSNITETYGASYTLTHLLSRRTTLAPTVLWTHQTDLENDADSETVDIIRFEITVNRQFTSHLAGGIGYRFQVRDSNIDGRSYEENSVSVNVNYAF